MLAAALAAAPALHAADIYLTAGDSFGNSSFNSAGNWSDATVPGAGNDYHNAGYLLRTPADTGSHVFGGDSLTITGIGLTTTVGNDALMWKGSGTGAIITVDNLTVDGGQLRHGQGTADSFTLAGNLAIGANGANMAAQGGMFISSAISGSSTIRILANGNGDMNRIIRFQSGANTFTGDIELYTAAQSIWALDAGANLNFVIGASGVNNRVFGAGIAGLNGVFDIDLSGASTTWGDSWTLVDAASLNETYGSTFSVAGFTDIGSGIWTKSENGVTYYFSKDTGMLNIPEPTSFAVLLAGLGALFAWRRQRKA